MDVAVVGLLTSVSSFLELATHNTVFIFLLESQENVQS